MAESSVYDPYKQAEEELEGMAKPKVVEEVEISGPIGLWIAILFIGLILDFVVAPLAPSLGIVTTLWTTAGNMILYQPGAFILPLIVSIWLASRIAHVRKESTTIGKEALLNSIYVAAIYSIAIFIIYLLIYYTSPASLPTPFTLQGFVLNMIAIPVAIVLVLTPVLSMLASARKGPKK